MTCSNIAISFTHHSQFRLRRGGGRKGESAREIHWEGSCYLSHVSCDISKLSFQVIAEYKSQTQEEAERCLTDYQGMAEAGAEESSVTMNGVSNCNVKLETKDVDSCNLDVPVKTPCESIPVKLECESIVNENDFQISEVKIEGPYTLKTEENVMETHITKSEGNEEGTDTKKTEGLEKSTVLVHEVPRLITSIKTEPGQNSLHDLSEVAKNDPEWHGNTNNLLTKESQELKLIRLVSKETYDAPLINTAGGKLNCFVTIVPYQSFEPKLTERKKHLEDEQYGAGSMSVSKTFKEKIRMNSATNATLIEPTTHPTSSKKHNYTSDNDVFTDNTKDELDGYEYVEYNPKPTKQDVDSQELLTERSEQNLVTTKSDMSDNVDEAEAVTSEDESDISEMIVMDDDDEEWRPSDSDRKELARNGDDQESDNEFEEVEIKCKKCEKTFSNKSSLSSHVLTVHVQKGWEKCNLCGKKCPTAQAMNRHLMNHSDPCAVCNKWHSARTKQSQTCGICGQLFCLVLDLRRHCRAQHPEQRKKEHQCDQCGKSYTTNYTLIQHLRTHTGEKPFKCCFCERAFVTSCELKRHILSHTKEKLFICETCGATFADQRGLRRHLQIHTVNKPHECKVCGKRFSQRCNLKTHSRTHTGEKQYRCTLCEESYSHFCSLQIHFAKSHPKEKQFKNVKQYFDVLKEMDN